MKIDQSVSRKYPKSYICVAYENWDEAIHEAYTQITELNIDFKSSIQNNPLSQEQLVLKQSSQHFTAGADLVSTQRADCQ